MEKKLTVVKPIKGDESEIQELSTLNVKLSVDTTTAADLYTPTPEELRYLLFQRAASTVGTTENARFAFVEITDQCSGILVFPDEYTHPSGIAVPMNINTMYAVMPATVTSYTVAELSDLEEAGCVFIPAAGRRIQNTGRDAISRPNTYTAGGVYYWTTRKTDVDKCFAFAIAPRRSRPESDSYYPQNCGFSVRLFNKGEATFTVAQYTTNTSETQYKKVGIVGGNLQYKPSTDEYRLAPHSYDFIGADNENVTLRYDGWIDLFGYGASGAWTSPAQSSADHTAYYPPDRNPNYTIEYNGEVGISRMEEPNLIRRERHIDYRKGDWGVYWSTLQSEFHNKKYLYTGDEVVIYGNTYYEMTPVDGQGGNLYLRQQTFAEGTLVYDSNAFLVGALSGSISLADYITSEDAIYRFGDVYYRRYGNEVVQVTDIEFPSIANPMELYDFTYDATRMGEAPTITATKMWYEWIDDLWEQDVHVHFNGEKYFITLLPTTSKENTDARYKYELTFRSERNALQEVYVFDTALPYDVATAITENTTFSFFGDINMFRKKINASLIQSKLASFKKRVDENGFEYVPDPLTKAEWNALPDDDPLRVEYHEYEAYLQYAYEYVDGEFVIEGFQIVIGRDEEGNVQTSEEKLIQIQNNTVAEVLAKIKDDYELAYYIQSGTKNIVIGDCEYDFGEDNPVNYGVDSELLTVTRTNSTKKIMTRITGVGSADNIPYYYPNPTPDGWIVPQYHRIIDGEDTIIPDVVIYDANSEAYLRNRLGFEYKYSKLEQEIVLGETNIINLIPTDTSSYSQPPENYGDIPIKVFFVLKEDMTVEFKNITFLLDDTNIFRIDVYYTPVVEFYSQTGEAIPLYEGYNNNTGSISVVSGMQLIGSYTDPNSFRNERRTLQRGSYRIVYHINAWLSSDTIQNVMTPYWMAYYNANMFARYNGIDNPYKLYGGVYCWIPTLFTKFKNLKPYWDNTFHRWMWCGVNYNNFTEWANAIYQQYGIVVNGENYIQADMATEYHTPYLPAYSTFEAHEANWPNGGSATMQTYGFYMKGANLHRRTDENANTPPLMWEERYLDQEGIKKKGAGTTLAQMYNLYFKGTITFHSLHWWASDMLPQHRHGSTLMDTDLLEYYGMSLPNGWQAELFDTIDFQGKKRVPYQPNLMPEVYIRTEGENRFYTAHNYDPVVEGVADRTIGEEDVDRDVTVAGETVHQDGIVNDIYHNTVDDTPSYHYVFETEWSPQTTYDHIENFDDVKPTIEGMRNPETPSGLRIDVAQDYAFDRYDDNSIWEEGTDGSGEYKHGYFFIKLRPLGFNIFDCALEEDMIISMKNGKCGACNFRIGVTSDPIHRNPVQIYTEDAYYMELGENGTPTYTKFADAGDLRRFGDGNEWETNESGVTSWGYYVLRDGQYVHIEVQNQRVTVTGDEIEGQTIGSLTGGRVERIEGDVITCGPYIEQQQNTTDNYVWLALEKDTTTFGRLMPSAQDVYNTDLQAVKEQPVGVNQLVNPEPPATPLTPEEAEEQADKFVILNIRMPLAYYRAAERRLAEKLVEYMYKNNYQQFDFSIDFSRIFLEQNPDFNARLNENSKMYIDFNGVKPYLQYVQHYMYKMSHDKPLPEIKVDMNPDKPVTKKLGQTLADEIIGDTPVTPTPTPIPVFPLRPTELPEVGGRGDFQISRDVINRMMPLLGRRMLTNSGINRITGDIISVQAGGSLNQIIRNTQELRRDMDATVEAVNSNSEAVLDVGTVIATERLITENTTPWQSLRFRQMFPDADYTNFYTTQNGLSVSLNSDGSFHVEGTITHTASISFIREDSDFIRDYIYDNFLCTNHFFALCFLSDAPYSVFNPVVGQTSDNPTIEPTYTRYIGRNGLAGTLSKCGISVIHDSEQESTYVSFDVKVRIYDLTEMFGVVTTDGCVLNRLLSQEVFTNNYLNGMKGESLLLPMVDYPYTDKYIIMHQQGYIYNGAVGSLVANYNKMFPSVFPQPDYMGGWTCIKDSDDVGTVDTMYDKTNGAQSIKRNIAKTELGSLVWNDAGEIGESGYYAILSRDARHTTKTVLCPLAKSYAVANAASASTECIYTKYEGGKSFIIIAQAIADSSLMGDRTSTGDGYHFSGLEGVYAEYLLEVPYNEFRQK